MTHSSDRPSQLDSQLPPTTTFLSRWEKNQERGKHFSQPTWLPAPTATKTRAVTPQPGRQSLNPKRKDANLGARRLRGPGRAVFSKETRLNGFPTLTGAGPHRADGMTIPAPCQEDTTQGQTCGCAAHRLNQAGDVRKQLVCMFVPQTPTAVVKDGDAPLRAGRPAGQGGAAPPPAPDVGAWATLHPEPQLRHRGRGGLLHPGS